MFCWKRDHVNLGKNEIMLVKLNVTIAVFLCFKVPSPFCVK